VPDTLVTLTSIFHKVFDDDSIELTRTTTAKDVEGWDSMMYINVIVNVERSLGIKFTSTEVAGLKNVGDMVDIVDKRLAAR